MRFDLVFTLLGFATSAVVKRFFWRTNITVLNIWPQHELIIKGETAIVKSLAITQLLYALPLLYVPDYFIVKVDKAIVSFVWRNKIPKVKSSTMIGVNWVRGGGEV